MADPDRSDAELLSAHVAGDRYAFEELFYRHYRQLYRLAVITSRNPEDAADALQDALFSAHRKASGFRPVLRRFGSDLRRDLSRNRVRRLGQAMVLAAELPSGVRRLHAHFIHTPASVVSYASDLTGLPWSCSAHAKDIWTIPEWEKREKMEEAGWGVTCTQEGAAHLDALFREQFLVPVQYEIVDRPRQRMHFTFVVLGKFQTTS